MWLLAMYNMTQTMITQNKHQLYTDTENTLYNIIIMTEKYMLQWKQPSVHVYLYMVSMCVRVHCK